MICFPLDYTQYNASDMGAYLATRTRGVFSADENLAVSASGTDMALAVGAGLAWLKASTYWGVVVLLESDMQLTLDAADGALSRIDTIVCRLDKVTNVSEIIVRKGSYSATPSITDPVRDDNADEIYLASVLVSAGATAITQAAITDLRINETYCGIMRDGVTGIPTAQLQEQADALIDSLQNALNGVLDGSEYMLASAWTEGGLIKQTKLPPPLDLTATLTASGWTGSAAPYTQVITLSGVLATDCPHITPVYSDTLATAIAQKEAWAAVSEADAGAGKITFTCFEDKPGTAIPLQIEVIR